MLWMILCWVRHISVLEAVIREIDCQPKLQQNADQKKIFWRERISTSPLNGFFMSTVCISFYSMFSGIVSQGHIVNRVSLAAIRNTVRYNNDYASAGNQYWLRFLKWKISYRKTSNISRILVCYKIVDHSDVVGASPVGAAPTTSS